jgi:peroxiredoxin
MPSDGASILQPRRRLRRLIALASLLGLLFGQTGNALANDVTVGRPAPPLVLHALDGSVVSTADLRGKVVIVAFWATWCLPCREELPLLSDYATRHAAQGLRILGFSLDGPDKLAEVRRIAATLNFPVGLLGSAWAGGYGRIWRLPVSFVIDRDGILRYNGWLADQEVWTEDGLDQVVGPLL